MKLSAALRCCYAARSLEYETIKQNIQQRYNLIFSFQTQNIAKYDDNCAAGTP